MSGFHPVWTAHRWQDEYWVAAWLGMRPCLRPVDAAHPCAAGHDALSADRWVPTNCTRLVSAGSFMGFPGSSVPPVGSFASPVSCSCQPREGRVPPNSCDRRLEVTLPAGYQRQAIRPMRFASAMAAMRGLRRSSSLTSHGLRVPYRSAWRITAMAPTNSMVRR